MFSWTRFRRSQSLAKTPAAQIPNHIGIIMDGNGRWAQKRGLPRSMGHIEGAKKVKGILKEAQDLGVKIVTLYTFSTENWKRPEEEINVLFRLLEKFLRQERDYMESRKIKFQVFGDLSKLPDFAQKVVQESIEASSSNSDMIVNFCLNYGGRAEIVESVKKIATLVENGEVKAQDISEELISKNLYSAGLADPDLIIRTSGEHRTSNFLLWQSAYSEYYFSSVLWPDFEVKDFHDALTAYASRQRRFGESVSLKEASKETLKTSLGTEQSAGFSL